MMMSRKILARKYARAFLNLYFDAFTDQEIAALGGLNQLFNANRGILCYLSLPGLAMEKRQEFLVNICEKFSLPASFQKMIFVLMEKSKVDLLPAIVAATMQEFLQRKHIIHFDVYSSHELLVDERDSIIGFLTKKTGAALVRVNFFIDESLICGIKMRSDGYIFEHSVARELKKIEQLLLERVHI